MEVVDPNTGRTLSLSPAEIDALSRMAAAEMGIISAVNPSATFTAAAQVVDAITNRAASPFGAYGNQTGVMGVMTSPNQFSPLNNLPGIASLPAAPAPIKEAVESYVGLRAAGMPAVFDDATHYYNPQVAAPTWGPALQNKTAVGVGQNMHVSGTLNTDPKPGPYSISAPSIPAPRDLSMVPMGILETAPPSVLGAPPSMPGVGMFANLPGALAPPAPPAAPAPPEAVAAPAAPAPMAAPAAPAAMAPPADLTAPAGTILGTGYTPQAPSFTGPGLAGMSLATPPGVTPEAGALALGTGLGSGFGVPSLGLSAGPQVAPQDIGLTFDPKGIEAMPASLGNNFGFGAPLTEMAANTQFGPAPGALAPAPQPLDEANFNPLGPAAPPSLGTFAPSVTAPALGAAPLTEANFNPMGPAAPPSMGGFAPSAPAPAAPSQPAMAAPAPVAAPAPIGPAPAPSDIASRVAGAFEAVQPTAVPSVNPGVSLAAGVPAIGDFAATSVPSLATTPAPMAPAPADFAPVAPAPAAPAPMAAPAPAAPVEVASVAPMAAPAPVEAPAPVAAPVAAPSVPTPAEIAATAPAASFPAPAAPAPAQTPAQAVDAAFGPYGTQTVTPAVAAPAPAAVEVSSIPTVAAPAPAAPSMPAPAPATPAAPSMPTVAAPAPAPAPAPASLPSLPSVEVSTPTVMGSPLGAPGPLGAPPGMSYAEAASYSVPGAAPSVVGAVQSSGLGAPAPGMSYGLDSFGGLTSFSASQLSRDPTMGTGPGLAGAIGGMFGASAPAPSMGFDPGLGGLSPFGGVPDPYGGYADPYGGYGGYGAYGDGGYGGFGSDPYGGYGGGYDGGAYGGNPAGTPGSDPDQGGSVW